jgi:hypothetical protein
MRNRIGMTRQLPLLAAMLCIGGAHAQVLNKPTPAFFWKISSPTDTVYLLGSIHLAPKEFYPLPREIEGAFASCSVLNVEIDIRNVDQSAVTPMIMSKGMYQGDDTLWAHLDEKTAAALKAWCAKAGFPDAALAKMKPWMAQTILALTGATASGMDPTSGIDYHFLNEADKPKKKIAAIETIESQLSAISSAPEKVQVADLKDTVDHVNDMSADMRKLVDLWLSGDETKELAEDSEISKDPEVVKTLLYDRNIVMADFVEKELKAGTRAFVVVGTAHTVGPKGIAGLLMARGYKVSRVMVTWTHKATAPLPAKPKA